MLDFESGHYPTGIAGAIQCDGQVRLERIPDVTRQTLHGFISHAVKDEVEAIYTDEWHSES